MRFETRRLRILVLLLLGLVLTVPTVRASDEDEPSPEDRYVAAVAALPTPAVKHAFAYEGEALMGGRTVGSMSFTAKPTDNGEGWNITEEMMLGGVFVRKTTATLDAHLAPLRGRVTGKKPGVEGFEISWRKTESGFAFRHAVTKAEVTERHVAHAGVTLHSLSAFILFVQMTPPGKATFAVTDFEPDPSEGESNLDPANWTQNTDGMHEGRPVLVAEGKKGADKLLRAWFEPKDRRLIGFVLKRPSQGMSLEFKVKPGGEEKTPNPLEGPAKTAKAAAMQAGLAFAEGDVDKIVTLLHWPTLYEDAKAHHEMVTAGNPDAETFVDPETFKTDVLDSIKTKLEQRAGQAPPRAMLEALLRKIEAQIETEETEEGFTNVKFPPTFRSLEITVGEFDGVWKVLRIPQ